ncbi:MAG: response regulator [Chloroflexi bacterium]|nr:response regulator [Chloroflexota bacterium]
MSRTVLVADDHAETRDLIRQVLEEELGCRTIVAENGREAVDLARRTQPDLILMDMRMPEVGGMEATRTLKADPATRHIPVLALTANSRPEERTEARQAGCTDFIEKPFDLEQLTTRVAQHFPPA